MKRYKFLSAALLGALLTMGTVTSCSDSGYLVGCPVLCS